MSENNRITPPAGSRIGLSDMIDEYGGGAGTESDYYEGYPIGLYN